jgi:hypothetical protein
MATATTASCALRCALSAQSGFSYISRPALSGRFYQLKALDPNGRKVKLYVDAYDGRIVKVKH